MQLRRSSSPAAPETRRSKGEALITRLSRADLIWTVIVVIGVIIAFVVPHLHLKWLTPLHATSAKQNYGLAGTAPLLAKWFPHVNWATLASVAIAVVVVVVGPRVTHRLSWWVLVVTTWMTSLSWIVALTLIDGPVGGWAHRMNGKEEYLSQLPHSGGVAAFIHGFASHIPLLSNHVWDDPIAGNPPGALLTFVGLDRAGFSGAWWASAFCVFVGSSAAAAILVTLRALRDEELAQRAAAFVAIAPTAVWIGVSADGYFAAVAAWGIALLAVSASGRSRRPALTAVAAGFLLGCSVYLDYGLILMAIPAMAVLLATRNFRPLPFAVLGAGIVASFFTLEGFWWFHGLDLLRRRYWAGVAHYRPYRYWVWANLVSLTCAVGLPAAIALRRVVNRTALIRRCGVHLVLAAFLVVIVISDVSGLSKAETERIWLPFAVWLVAAPVLLPKRMDRISLTAQAIGALVINSLLYTNW
jgi:hypothetical protein